MASRCICRYRQHALAKHRNAFTLVEVLVVIGIIVLLIGFLLPAMLRARRTGVRTAIQADFQTILLALEAYKYDFGDYPRPDKNVTSPFQGSAIVCWALIAPGPAKQDGADGPGFRIRGTFGEVKGPYLSSDKLTIGVPSDPNNPIAVIPIASGAYSDPLTVLGDRLGNAILYYPKKLSSGAVTSVSTYIASHTLVPVPRYISDDNDPVRAFGSLGNLQAQMPGVRPDGTVDQSQVVNVPFLLWSAGPDGRFGTADDVTNFK